MKEASMAIMKKKISAKRQRLMCNNRAKKRHQATLLKKRGYLSIKHQRISIIMATSW